MNFKKLIGILSLLMVTNRLANFYMTKYKTENDSIEVEKGIIKKKKYYISYDEVSKLTVDKSMTDHLIGTKSLFIVTDDPVESQYKFKYVPDHVISEVSKNRSQN